MEVTLTASCSILKISLEIIKNLFWLVDYEYLRIMLSSAYYHMTDNLNPKLNMTDHLDRSIISSGSVSRYTYVLGFLL